MSKPTDDEIRVAIAEFCGIQNNDIWSYALPKRVIRCTVPDYLNDLNAIHEAASKLIFSKRRLFVLTLQHIMSEGLTECMIDLRECVFATARQRALALYRVIKQ